MNLKSIISLIVLAGFVYFGYLFHPIPPPSIIQPKIYPTDTKYIGYVYNNIIDPDNFEFNTDDVECSIGGDNKKWHADKINGQYICDMEEYKKGFTFVLGESGAIRSSNSK